MEPSITGAIFDRVDFVVIPGNYGSETGEPTELITALVTHGARQIHLREDNDEIESLTDVTHIISTHVNFPQYLRAIDAGVLVVKPSWVIQSLLKGKRTSERQHSPDPSQFFQDVVVTIGGLPDGDKFAISGGVLALGGQYSSALSKLTTHLVTMSEDDIMYTVARDKQLNCQIVIPHWFDDCLKLGKRIDERPYTFPQPEILDINSPDLVRTINPADMSGATGISPPLSAMSVSNPVTPPASPWRKNRTAFRTKRVLLSRDVDLADHLRTTLQTLIDASGGSVVDDVDAADIVICQFRDGPDYVAASQAQKEVANMAWLYTVIVRDRYTSPTSKLLHYPVPREPLLGFKDLKISISNYSGEARVYVENLVKACGAEFTKAMKQDNTHLITAHLHSEKVEAAQEWNINIVNHIWLEESYAKCALQALTNPRYTTFPARTNLSEVVGRTSLDMGRVEHCYFRRSASVDTFKASKPVRKAKVQLEAALVGSAPGEDADSRPESNDTTAEGLKVPDNATPACTTRGTHKSVLSETAANPAARDDEKENESPSFRSAGRASKMKALNVMTEQAHDIAKFQKEMKRKGGVTHGGRRTGDDEERSSPLPVLKRGNKRKSDEMTYQATNEESDLSDGETQINAMPTNKRAKQTTARSVLPPIQYRMVVTGYDRWTDRPKQCDTDKMKLRSLGILVTDDHRDVDIVVAPKILRTRKFVCALAAAPLVVDTHFLDSALKARILDKNPPQLEDCETENRLGFKLSEALGRAKLNAGRLLRNWSIFVTKEITGGFDTFKDIITVNGGAAYMYAGRTGLDLSKKRLRNDPGAGEESQHQGEDDEYDYIYLVSGESASESKLWKTFRDVATKHDLTARVVKSDWLLNAAMSQQIVWKSEWELHDR